MAANPLEYIFPGAIAAQAIYAATKLGIPDLLAAGPKTVADLASGCGADEPTLERLLRALTSLAIFERTPDGSYRNTPSTDVLRSDHPKTQRDGAMFLTAPMLWLPLGELTESVQTGKPAFNRIFGQSFFEFLSEHKEEAALFNRVMTQGVAWTSPALLKAYDFSGFTRLVDVGGGQGALLHDILAATPKLEGVLFDLPAAVAGANEILLGDVARRIEVIGGNFFDYVPEGADAYILKGVIHDWADEDAARILENIRRAMQAGGTLLLVETLADCAERPSGLGDLLMLVIGGRDRTQTEFRLPLESSGFTLTQVIPAGANSLIECHPR
ncbi:MAG: methyltransferase [Terracidiphilus sp.]